MVLKSSLKDSKSTGGGGFKTIWTFSKQKDILFRDGFPNLIVQSNVQTDKVHVFQASLGFVYNGIKTSVELLRNSTTFQIYAF